MIQASLFGPDPDAGSVKPAGDQPETMRVLIVVKAAPNPSQAYGETVCVAALRLDLEHQGWIRLYPINFRELDQPNKFRKYDIVSLRARPARADPRYESWRPVITSVTTVGHLDGWRRRRRWIDDYLGDTACGLLAQVRQAPPARSLGAVRAKDVDDLIIERHPGWSAEEQAKIDAYVSQLDLLDHAPRTALQAPRFKAWYRYRCEARSCPGHRQGLLDWEFVAHQRKLTDRTDAEAASELRNRWLGQMCAADRETVLFVGNQAKRQHVFSVLGLFYPRR
jgi:hypothetical protein